MERTCRKCGETKPIEEFAKDKRKLYGYTYRCKKCSRIISKIYHEKHRELVLKKMQKRNKIYYQQNKDKIKTATRDYIYKNIDKHKGYCKKYKLRNAEIIRQKDSLYRKINHRRIYDKVNETIDNCSNTYVMQLIRISSNLPLKIIRQYPELIENYRQQIKLKRLIKKLQNEQSIKTS